MYSDEYQQPVLTIDYNCSVESITFQHLNNWFGLRSRSYANIKVTKCKFSKSYFGIQSSGGPSEITNCIFDSCGTAISLPIWIGDYVIINNVILNCYHYWAIYIQVHSAIVENNIIINQPGADITSICSGILYGDVIIRNNIVVYGLGGIGVDASKVCNNTAKYMGRGHAIGYADSIYNNAISDCMWGIGSDTFFVANYNNLWHNEIDFYEVPGDSIGNIFCNPMYVDDDNHDYHLQAFSPLIDAGDPNVLDVDGTRSDIGAYGGPYGESYEYLDLSPAIPDSLLASFVTDTITINWLYNTEADFSHYILFRDTTSGFEPSVFNQIAEPETSFYIDADVDREHNYYYRIASIDNQDNLSDYSVELEVVTTGIWDQSGATLPQITVIHTNYPNPFNTSTTIIYSVANLGPIPAQIDIEIYDILGRKVRWLANARLDVGAYQATWDGRDDQGEEVQSGVYFARISQWGATIINRPKKIVLLR